MSRFLRFLLTAYAPLAARHMLVDGLSSYPAAGMTATKAKPCAADFRRASISAPPFAPHPA